VSIVVQSDASNVTVSLSRFALSLGAREQLMNIIGVGQLKSVRQTFRDSGSPSGSWPPLSPASLSWRKYSTGHKLLVDTGLLLNSITFAVQGNSVVDRHRPALRERPAVRLRWRPEREALQLHAPPAQPRHFRQSQITNKLGRSQTCAANFRAASPRSTCAAFTRHIRIPPRPFLVFRPEDPARIQSEVDEYVNYSRPKQAGLEAKLMADGPNFFPATCRASLQAN
jgi:phage gpG-like protein